MDPLIKSYLEHEVRQRRASLTKAAFRPLLKLKDKPALSERELRHAEMMTCDMRSAIERHFRTRDQKQAADLKASLVEQLPSDAGCR